MTVRKLRIGTRGSKLARWQAEWVKVRLTETYPDLSVELRIIKTSGDKIVDVPLAAIGGKGLFVKEIENALLDGRVDLAVHSMKDVPMAIPQGLEISCVPRREDPFDALISQSGERLVGLVPKARIGTSSLRRQAQLLNYRPDFEMVSLRGNLDTRLRKLEEQNLDAIVVASAGLRRMGLEHRRTERIPAEICLPAIGQGALAIETNRDDQDVREAIAFLNDPETAVTVRGERAFLRRLEGGCQVPIAAYAQLAGDTLRIEGLVASVDGKDMVRDRVSGSNGDAEALGVRLAERILNSGGDRILEAIYARSP